MCLTDTNIVGLQEEKTLVQGLCCGDATAYEELASRLFDHYVQIIERKYRNRQDAEEIVNNAAYKIISKIDTYDGSKSKSFWNWRKLPHLVDILKVELSGVY